MHPSRPRPNVSLSVASTLPLDKLLCILPGPDPAFPCLFTAWCLPQTVPCAFLGIQRGKSSFDPRGYTHRLWPASQGHGPKRAKMKGWYVVVRSIKRKRQILPKWKPCTVFIFGILWGAFENGSWKKRIPPGQATDFTLRVGGGRKEEQLPLVQG